jgi:tRNA modification GTPase
MPRDLQDTIVALSSASGPGGRAIVRLSGPDALPLASRFFTADEPIAPFRRHCYPGRLQLPGVPAPLPADLYVWPAPRTYTGQSLTELHTLSCPPLVDVLIAGLLDAGARAATAGEFTLRAFLSGKLDLTRAEAVLAVIEAGNRDQLQQALAQLAGGVTRPLQELRSDLLDLLADVEAGLDFTEEDIHFISQVDLLKRISKGLALVTLLGKQLQQRTVANDVFRVVLAGRPNAGKSSLFNALTGGTALVSAEPGTTRDYLVRRMQVEDVPIDLIDTAGRRESGDAIEEQSQTLGRDQAGRADLVLVCVEAGQTPDPGEAMLLECEEPPGVLVVTKCDLLADGNGCLGTSVLTGAGLDELRALLLEWARTRPEPALAPSLARCRHHVEACLQHLRQAHATALYEEPPELLALELRGALDEVGEMAGAVYTDDLLDRIFSRFCIGK